MQTILPSPSVPTVLVLPGDSADDPVLIVAGQPGLRAAVLVRSADLDVAVDAWGDAGEDAKPVRL